MKISKAGRVLYRNMFYDRWRIGFGIVPFGYRVKNNWHFQFEPNGKGYGFARHWTFVSRTIIPYSCKCKECGEYRANPHDHGGFTGIYRVCLVNYPQIKQKVLSNANCI